MTWPTCSRCNGRTIAVRMRFRASPKVFRPSSSTRRKLNAPGRLTATAMATRRVIGIRNIDPQLGKGPRGGNHPELVKEKRLNVRLLGNALFERAADAVTSGGRA